jgi:EmrB/QacA subfamily drug resistance transporter
MVNGFGIDAQSNPRRWKALAVLALVQFMLVVDMTVVNVALPTIKGSLGFSPAGLAWVVNGYTLMAGGLLLLGGRIADLFGRRRFFLIGLAGFALASLACGLAASSQMLVASRFVQGAGAAFATPAALGLVALLFPDPKERMKALGIWGGMAGLGGTTGTVISGALTGLASWRWIFLINIPVALLALLLVPRLVDESRMSADGQDSSRRLDFLGPLTATAGLIAIVDGLLGAANNGWTSSDVLLPTAAGLILLALFVFIEARIPAPMIPLGFFANRTRSVANAAFVLSSSTMFAYFFLLTLFIQQVLRFTPLQAGFAYVPFGLAFGAGIGASTALMPRLGVRAVLTLGLFGAAVAMLVAAGITPASNYVVGVLPGMLILGFSSGVSFPAASNASLHQVTGQDAGLASGVQSTAGSIGGAIGLSCLAAFAIQHALDEARHGVAPAVALTSGYAASFRLGAALMVVASVLAVIFLEQVRTTAPAMRDSIPQELAAEPEAAA